MDSPPFSSYFRSLGGEEEKSSDFFILILYRGFGEKEERSE